MMLLPATIRRMFGLPRTTPVPKAHDRHPADG
jgi:hypothetical protein